MLRLLTLRNRFFTLPFAFLGALWACSAGDSTPLLGNNSAEAGSKGGVVVPSDPSLSEGAVLVTEEEAASMGGTDAEGKPLNLGTETRCDGLDENNNGVIDDVDVGKDGLCDCIHLGFIGEVSSDAGSQTGQFEAWLVARSGEVPVKHLSATEPLTEAWLADLQVVIVGGLAGRALQNPTFGADELAALTAWLTERGGGLFTLAGYTDDARDAAPTSQLLSVAGLSYDLTSVPAEGVIGMGMAPPVWLDGIVAPEHPAVLGVPQIGVYYGYPVEGDGTVILRGSGYDLAIAKEVEKGRVFAFADEWITQDQTWSGLSEGQNNPCQQPCNEADNICPIASSQCARCAMEPCSDPNDTDPEACFRGCQPSCDSETARCETYAEQCSTCEVEAQALAEATPRLWLNAIRWLTPENECKVDIPPTIKIK